MIAVYVMAFTAGFLLSVAFVELIPEAIDRIDYRPGSNIFKVVTNEGYLEVQVDGAAGQRVPVEVGDRAIDLAASAGSRP